MASRPSWLLWRVNEVDEEFIGSVVGLMEELSCLSFMLHKYRCVYTSEQALVQASIDGQNPSGMLYTL